MQFHQDLIGKNVLNLIWFYPSDRERFRQVMLENESVKNYKIDYKKKDGSLCIVEANGYLESSASQGKKFLFIGTKRQASTLIAQEAKRCNSFYVNHRWLGGMLTNWTTLKDRIERLKSLEQQEADNIFNLLTKKEAALRRKELQKLRNHLDGIKNMEDLPDIAIIIDQKREMTAIRECRKLGIPILSILDTNCDPDLVDIPIPGNDDAVRSIKLILKSLTDSIIKGKSELK